MNLAPTELRQDMHSSREKERLPESPILRAPPHECGLKHVRTPNQFFNGIKLRDGYGNSPWADDHPLSIAPRPQSPPGRANDARKAPLAPNRK